MSILNEPYYGFSGGSGISECINGKQRTANGYHWIKIGDEL